MLQVWKCRSNLGYDLLIVVVKDMSCASLSHLIEAFRATGRSDFDIVKFRDLNGEVANGCYQSLSLLPYRVLV